MEDIEDEMMQMHNLDTVVIYIRQWRDNTLLTSSKNWGGTDDDLLPVTAMMTVEIHPGERESHRSQLDLVWLCSILKYVNLEWYSHHQECT
jgi:hypothetical protein